LWGLNDTLTNYKHKEKGIQDNQDKEKLLDSLFVCFTPVIYFCDIAQTRAAPAPGPGPDEPTLRPIWPSGTLNPHAISEWMSCPVAI